VQAGLLLAFFPVAYLVARWLRGEVARTYALDHTPAGATISLFVLACIAKAGALVVGGAMGVYDVGPVRGAQVLSTVAPAALVTVFPSIAEDIVTRGFWFGCGRGPQRPSS
jgi:hypothetical protein